MQPLRKGETEWVSRGSKTLRGVEGQRPSQGTGAAPLPRARRRKHPHAPFANRMIRETASPAPKEPDIATRSRKVDGSNTAP